MALYKHCYNFLKKPIIINNLIKNLIKTSLKIIMYKKLRSKKLKVKHFAQFTRSKNE